MHVVWLPIFDQQYSASWDYLTLCEARYYKCMYGIGMCMCMVVLRTSMRTGDYVLYIVST